MSKVCRIGCIHALHPCFVRVQKLSDTEVKIDVTEHVELDKVKDWMIVAGFDPTDRKQAERFKKDCVKHWTKHPADYEGLRKMVIKRVVKHSLQVYESYMKC